jgi:hypothetical protein
MGSRNQLLGARVTEDGVAPANAPSYGLKWRAMLDEDEHYVYAVALR